MNPEETPFEQFFAERIKAKGFSLKKLAEVSGVAPSHIENLLRGDFESIPSAPYFRGYLLRLGKALDFEGEAWWIKLKKDAGESGEPGILPKSHLMKSAPPKYLWVIIAGIVVLIYLGLQFSRIFGKPALAITSPLGNPYTTATNTITIQGTSHNADSISLNGDPVTVAADGTWQKGVLLQDGLNTFEVVAKKFLGGETDVMEQIWYQTPVGTASSTASSTAGTTSSTVSSTPIF